MTEPVEGAMTLGEALELAERYAGRGIPTFPIAIGWDEAKGKTTKRPLTRHGHLDASTDVKKVRLMFNGHAPLEPGSVLGVGLHLGPAGWFVLDADRDTRGDGVAELEAILAHHGIVDTVRTITASGGVHAWLSKGTRHVSNASPYDAIDIRGDEGWVVAPGTVTPWGEWSFDPDRDLFDGTPVAAAPDSLLDEIGAGAPGETRQSGGVHGRRDLPAELDPRDRAALDALLRLGGTYSHRDRTSILVTRPGKTSGTSASVGHIGPGLVKVFTSNWPPLIQNRVYDADELTTLAEQGTGGPAAADEPWPEPIPLSDATELPPFPVDALPAWIAEHAVSVAGELQVPVDLPAMLALAALSTVAAGRTEVAVRSTWREQVNLYLVIAMPPGSGKSPAFRAMLGALERFEADQVTKTARVIAEAEQRHRMLEKALKKAEEKGDAHEAARILGELHDHEVPKPPRLIADDATPEALVRILAEQNGRLALLSTEGGVFDLMAGRYSEKANLDVYLQSWAGDTIRVDRVRDAVSIVIRRPTLTIGLTVQPSVIAALAERPELAGRGLVARFMYAVPEDIVGRRNLIDAPMADPEAKERYDARLLALAQTLSAYQAPGTLTLDGEAVQRFLQWRQGLEERRAPLGDLRPLAEWTTKLESSTARLAGLLHLANGGRPHGEVGVEAVDAALEVAGYWLHHAKAVHDLWGTNPTLARARKVLEWLQTLQAEEFSVRDLYAANRRVFERAEDTVEPLNLLVERGWVRPLFDGELRVGRRRVPSPRFAVHPLVRAMRAMRAPGGHDEAPSSADMRAVRAMRVKVKKESLTLLEERSTDAHANTQPRAHGAHCAQSDAGQEADAEAVDNQAGSAPHVVGARSTDEARPTPEGRVGRETKNPRSERAPHDGARWGAQAAVPRPAPASLRGGAGHPGGASEPPDGPSFKELLG